VLDSTPTFAPTPTATTTQSLSDVESSSPLGAGTPTPPSVFLPAIVRQATPTATSTPRPEWLSEDWDCSNFPLTSGETYIQKCGEDNGTYEIHRLNVSYTQAWSRSPWSGSRTAFEANVRLVQGKAHYHLFFNNTFYKGFYSFGVNPNDRTWSLWRVDNEVDWVPLINWTRSDFINPGNEVNLLRAERHDDTITVFVNGQPLGAYSDSTYRGSFWGVYTRNSENNSIIHYSDIMTYVHSSIVLTPTPMPPWELEEKPCDDYHLKSDETLSYTHECIDYWTLAMRHPAPFGSVAHGQPDFLRHDYSIEASAAMTKGAGDYHIAFNGYGWDKYYTYGVNPANGTYSLGLITMVDRSNGDKYTYKSIGGWKSSPHIRKGSASNHLRFVHDGQEYRFYINDHLVDVTKWEDLDAFVVENSWGFFTSSTQPNTEVIYSNIQIQSR